MMTEKQARDVLGLKDEDFVTKGNLDAVKKAAEQMLEAVKVMEEVGKNYKKVY